MLEQDSKWLDRDALKINPIKMKKSSFLRPILKHIQKLSPIEIPDYNQIKFMFEKILLDKGLIPGIQNFAWV